MVEKRYVLAALSFFGTFNVYSIRNGITGGVENMRFLTFPNKAEFVSQLKYPLWTWQTSRKTTLSL